MNKKDLKTVKRNGLKLQYVEEQTPEICIAAVKQNGYALQYVKEQSPELCMEAVKQNGYALQHVKEQSPENCLAAVKNYGWALLLVKNQTLEICLAAKGDILEHIEDKNLQAQYRQIKIEAKKTKKPKSILGEIAKKLSQEGIYTKQNGNNLRIEKDNCIIRLTLTDGKISFQCNFDKDLANPNINVTLKRPSKP